MSLNFQTMASLTGPANADAQLQAAGAVLTFINQLTSNIRPPGPTWTPAEIALWQNIATQAAAINATATRNATPGSPAVP